MPAGCSDATNAQGNADCCPPTTSGLCEKQPTLINVLEQSSQLIFYIFLPERSKVAQQNPKNKSENAPDAHRDLYSKHFTLNRIKIYVILTSYLK